MGERRISTLGYTNRPVGDAAAIARFRADAMMPADDAVAPRGPDAFLIARVRVHSFLAAPITSQSTVIDLGMNVGRFATTMISGFGCSVVGVEPVPELFAAIPKRAQLTAEQPAITADGRPVTLFRSPSSLAATIDEGLSEQATPTLAVKGTTFAEILNRRGIARTHRSRSMSRG